MIVQLASAGLSNLCNGMFGEGEESSGKHVLNRSHLLILSFPRRSECTTPVGKRGT